MARGVAGAALFALVGGTTATRVQASEPAKVRSPVMLANVYRPGTDLSAYWASEKMDGVRGYWDGRALWTRGGQPVHPPAWFTAGWPNIPMDGELWAGRGHFSHAVSTVRQQQPDDRAWRRMRFMVFDLPAQPGTFSERLAVLNGLLGKSEPATAIAVAQTRVSDHVALMKMMQTIVKGGGEGVMLHRDASLYRAERNDDLLKVKPFEDADAKVIGYAPGHGKYAGMLGALLVQLPDGKRMRIGSGLRDADRRHPPAIGHWISYRYRGLNDSGLPRFATFLRERPDLD
jgi:DNA ligase-1